MRLHTFGHGTADAVEIAGLVRGAAIEAVVDVRSIPKSRVHPHVWAERMAQWVPDLSGAAYEWRPELGGFRRPAPESPNFALCNPAFRGYADYMQTVAFAAALGALAEEAQDRSVAIMCSETLWWKCHRRLISDALVLVYGADVQHLVYAGNAQPHRVTEGARLLPGGLVRYDNLTLR